MTRSAIARAIVRLASTLVPSGRRPEWRAEWNGELAERERRANAGVIRFALGAVPHGLAELRQDWNADVLAHELRNAARTQLRNPAYSLTAALLIALGVGANTTVFTLVNTVLWRAPHGIADADRLVQLGRTNAGAMNQSGFDSWSYPLFLDFRTRSTSFADMTAYETRDVLIGDDADVAQVNVQLVSANYFGVLGAVPQMGRGFIPDDMASDAPPVVFLSHGLWQARYGGDPSILGKSVRLRGTEFRVVGIAAPGFAGTEIVDARPELWAPIVTAPLITPGSEVRYDSRAFSWLWVVGRLKPGVEIEAARVEMQSMYRGIQMALSDTVREAVVLTRGLGIHPDARVTAVSISMVLLAMVGLVLLITCANLAALLLARGAAREGEIGVRLAVGAGRHRVIRQLLMETALLALLGSVLAFIATRWTVRFVEWVMPFEMAVSIQPDVRVLIYGVLVGVTTALAFGIIPAFRSTRIDLQSLLRSGAGGAGASGVDRGRLRSGLLVAQVALSFVLLGAAGLLARSVQRASSVDPGFRTERILTGDVDVLTTLNATAESRWQQLEGVAARVRHSPGVEAASLASGIPTAGDMGNRTMWRADGVGTEQRPPAVLTMYVDTAYLPMMGVPVLAGRGFDGVLDRPGVPTAIVINETLAKRFWPGESAVGKQITFPTMAGPRNVTVVGVARDTRNRSLRPPSMPQAYLPLSQHPRGQAILHVRVAASQTGLTAQLTTDLQTAMRGTAPIRFETLRSRMAQGYADARLIGILGAVFGVLALLVASGGIYGVVSYEAARRRREFGVRLALGARPSQVNAMVIKRSARLSAIGIAFGLLAFAGVAPLMSQWVFGISTFDPVTLATITGVLLASATIAAIGPAVRASRADPITSLRSE